MSVLAGHLIWNPIILVVSVSRKHANREYTGLGSRGCPEGNAINSQKIFQNGDTIDVTQFAALLDDIRSNWNLSSYGAHDGLSLFFGDLFSPSVESTVTRGSHMVR